MDGEFVCYEWKGASSLLNQRVCRLQDFGDGLDARFLFYGINKYLKEIEAVTGFTTVKHISSKQILAIQFPLPPLPEQKRIVAILDEAFEGIDAAIANAEKNLANARELVEIYLNSAFAQKGTGWVEKKLGDIATFKNGLNFTKNSKGELIKIVGVKDFQKNFFVPMSQLETVQIDRNLGAEYELQTGDILTVRSNGNKQLMGAAY